jgi:hypothetical protein
MTVDISMMSSDGPDYWKVWVQCSRICIACKLALGFSLDGAKGGEGLTKHMRDTLWIQLVCERHEVCNQTGLL